MPRINVYLPDALAALAEPLDLNLSQLLQSALRDRIACDRLDRWLSELRQTPSPGPSRREVRMALEGGEPGVLH